MISWIAAEFKGTWSFSSRLFSTPSIQSSISSKPSCTLRDRVRVIWSFSFLSFTDFDKLSYLSTISSDKEKIHFKVSFSQTKLLTHFIICHQVKCESKIACIRSKQKHQLYSVKTHNTTKEWNQMKPRSPYDKWNEGAAYSCAPKSLEVGSHAALACGSCWLFPRNKIAGY